MREGLLVVLSAPSGTGKGTVIKELMAQNDNIKLSVSATTRNPREGETDGQHYFFKSVDDFCRMIDNNELVEWVKYCDNYYGTPRKYIEEATQAGYDVFLELEVEGAANIRDKYPGCILIFLLPPSFEELERRIVGRGTEQPETIHKRLSRAREEMHFIDQYDYVVINGDLNQAVRDIQSILAAERLRYTRSRDMIKELGMMEV